MSDSKLFNRLKYKGKKEFQMSFHHYLREMYAETVCGNKGLIQRFIFQDQSSREHIWNHPDGTNSMNKDTRA